jgi:hypothetical protein
MIRIILSAQFPRPVFGASLDWPGWLDEAWVGKALVMQHGHDYFKVNQLKFLIDFG